MNSSHLQPVDDRDDDNLLLMERLLLLLRNVLHVPQDDNQENVNNAYTL